MPGANQLLTLDWVNGLGYSRHTEIQPGSI
jgi:hypothetical protein